MMHSTSTRTTPDGLTLLTRQWTPDGERRGVVVLVHGVHEHSGRYSYVASELMRRGLEVRALDLRGHGESEGPRGQVESFDEYVADVATFLDEAIDEAGDLPVFLLGHSMGGLVVSATVVWRGTEGLRGIALSSPALQIPADTSPLLQKIAPYVARWLPNVPATKVDHSHISRDPVVVRNYATDPLVTHRGVKARLGYEVLRTIEHVRQHPQAFDVPLFLFHGTADRIVDPAGTEWLAAHAATDDVTLTMWDGLFHETLNEPERDDVIGALADWFESKLPAR